MSAEIYKAGSYREELQDLVDKFRAAHPGRDITWASGQVDEHGLLTGVGARDLHEALCRHAGLTADQIIADWNRRSPGDTW